MLPDDVEEVDPVEPWAALLPVLDPTTMGWKERDFYLDPGHAPYLFDSNGNGGTTAWWNGRVVGCWVQDDDGVVQVVLREDVDRAARVGPGRRGRAPDRWLDGVRISTVYTSRPDEVGLAALIRLPCAAVPPRAARTAGPPVQRLRIRYAKRGRLRFTSHRDFSRAFERAVFRARVPMAYSSGFNPHPRISYAGAAPTGSASEAEYLEIALAEVVDPADVRATLEEALPDGLDVLEVVESPGGLARRPARGQPLADRPRRAAPDVAARPWTAFLAAAVGAGRADDQEGPARASTAAPPWCPCVAEARPERGAPARRSCCATRCPRSAPTTC